MEGRADVPDPVELVPQPGFAQQLGIAAQLRPLRAALERCERRLRRDHPRLHRRVGALDLGHVEEARGVADQRAAREHQLGDRLEPTLGQGACAIGDPPAALEETADGGVGLVALHLLERREMWVRVVEPDHEAHRDQVVAEHVEPGAAIGVARHRPADRVDDLALAVPRGVDFPQLLDTEPVGLRLHALAQVEPVHGDLGQGAATALGQQRQLGMQLHPGLEVRPLLAGLGDTHVAGGDAAHAPRLVLEQLGRGEAGIDLDPQRLGLLPEPAHHIAEADDVVALVVHLRRRRQPERPGLGEVEELVARDRRVQGGSLLLPVRDQLVQRARLEACTREDVGAHLRALLENADRDLRTLLGRELLQSDRRGQPGRAGADDDDVIFHRFAFQGRLRAGLSAGRLRRSTSAPHGEGGPADGLRPGLRRARTTGGRTARPGA